MQILLIYASLHSSKDYYYDSLFHGILQEKIVFSAKKSTEIMKKYIEMPFSV